MTDFSFKKAEKLKSHKLIEQLFAKGESFAAFPIRIVWIKIEGEQKFPTQFALTVPKKRFKKAVDRNRIRRQMREAYRLNKHTLYEGLENRKDRYGLMFIYIADKEKSSKEIEKATKKIIRRFLRTIG